MIAGVAQSPRPGIPTDAFKLTAEWFHLSLDQIADWGVPWNSNARKAFTETGLSSDTF